MPDRNRFTAAKRRGGAFTLIELLVVIGLVALLISILLPALNNARRSAANVKCLSNLRQLGTSIASFTNDHKGWMVKRWYNQGPYHPDDISAASAWGYRDPLQGWDYVLSTYADGAADVFRCPSDDANLPRGAQNDGKGKDGTGEYPDLTNQELLADKLAASYRFNTSNNEADFLAYKTTSLINPTRQIMIVDGKSVNSSFGVSAEHGIMSNEPFFESDDPIHDNSVSCGPTFTEHMAPYRHTASGSAFQGLGATRRPVFRTNAAFADGHAESLVYEDTWKPVESPVKFAQGTPVNGLLSRAEATGVTVVGVPTMWRQLFFSPSVVDAFDNPFVPDDDDNPRPHR